MSRRKFGNIFAAALDGAIADMETNGAAATSKLPWLTTCWEFFTHADGRVELEKLWYLIAAGGRINGESRFLGLVDKMSEAEALAMAARIYPGAIRVR